MNELRDVQALDFAEPAGPGCAGDGSPSAGELRGGPARVGVLPAAPDVPKARASQPRSRRGAGEVARKSGRNTGRRIARLNAALFAIALEELMSGPTTRAELEERTGLGKKTVQSIVWTLHKRKLIHVAGWEKDVLGRFTMPAFEFGRGKDAPKPAPKTMAELRRGYVERKARRDALHASAGVCIQLGA